MTRCTIFVPQPGHFVYRRCGRPATHAIAGTDTRVCRDCRREYHRHMPARVFRPVTAMTPLLRWSIDRLPEALRRLVLSRELLNPPPDPWRWSDDDDGGGQVLPGWRQVTCPE